MGMRILALFLIMALPAMAADLKENPGEDKVLATPGGRFVFGQISAFRKDQYMLDTQTGRLWQMVADEKGRQALNSIPYETISGSVLLEAPSQEEEFESMKRKIKAEETAATNTPETKK
jgi:hypothetical protein